MNENEKTNETAEVVSENEIAVKRNKKTDLVIKIGCVLAAFFIWLYVMAVDSPPHEQEFTSVPVEIYNESGLSVLQGAETTINVTVMGKRSLLNNLTVEDLNAYISLDKSNHGTPGKYSCPVQFSLPGGVSLVSSSLSAVNVYLDNTTDVAVPIEVVITDYMLQDGYELRKSDIVTDIAEVHVTGPATELEKIHHAQMNVALGHVTRSVTVSGELYLVDADGEPINNTYIKMQQSYATAYIPVFKYRTIELSSTFKYKYFNSSNASVSFYPKTITIKGEIDTVDAYSWVYEINEKQITPGNNTYTIPLSLPEGIYSADNLEAVSCNIKTTGIADGKRTVKVEVNNPNKFKYELTPKYIEINIRGASDYVSKITANEIVAEIDLSNLTSASGFVSLPVNIKFADGYTDHLFVTSTNPDSITVKLS